jgi:dUTP pyrophosphatase
MAIFDAGMVEVGVALLSPHAFLPVKAHPTDAGFDLAVPADCELGPHEHGRIDFEIAIEIPPGWYGQIFGRSSVFHRGLSVHPGVIDADYRGSIQLLIVNQLPTRQVFSRGDRLAQLLVLPVPLVTMTQVSVQMLSQTTRGSGGLGSTGR